MQDLTISLYKSLFRQKITNYILIRAVCNYLCMYLSKLITILAPAPGPARQWLAYIAPPHAHVAPLLRIHFIGSV